MGQESGGNLGITMTTGKCQLIVILVVISGLCIVTEAKSQKCYKNEDLKEAVGNVYFCTDVTKTECCEEDMQFTCCESQTKKTLEDQLILWGGVFAVAMVIAGLCCYFWRDCNCLREDTRCGKICCCCKKKVDEQPLTSIDDPKPDFTTNWPPPSFSQSRGFERDNTDTPPPFFYKNPSGKY